MPKVTSGGVSDGTATDPEAAQLPEKTGDPEGAGETEDQEKPEPVTGSGGVKVPKPAPRLT